MSKSCADLRVRRLRVVAAACVAMQMESERGEGTRREGERGGASN
jgi:hypothetical protein